MKRGKFLLLLGLCFLPVSNVYAAGSGSIAASDTVVNGSTVTATITLRNVAAWNVRASGSGSTNGCSAHEVGDSGNGNNTTKSFSITCKATSLGTINFSFSGDVTSSDGDNRDVSGSKQVTVVKPREKSNNNNLKSLSIEGVSITPEFNKDTLEYSAEVGDEVETIKINASMEDSYGHIDGIGDKELAEGLNKFEIKAISETGLEKVYVLSITVKDNNPKEEKIDGKTYTLVKRASSLVLPEGLNKESFELSKVTIDEVEVPSYKSEELKLELIGLKDDKGNVYLFKYENEQILGKYELLSSKGLSIEFINAKSIPDGYSKTEITVDGKVYTAYQNKYKNYALIYGKNLETNEENWYSYNIKEGSIQKYNGEVINDLNKEIKTLKDNNQVLLISLIGASALFLLILIVEIVFNNKNKKQLKKLKNNEVAVEKEEIKQEKKSNKKKEEQAEISEDKVSEIAEKVEEPVKEKKKKKKEEKEDTIPTLEEIEEDLKPTKEEKVLTPEDEKLKEIEEFYGKVRRGKKYKL